MRWWPFGRHETAPQTAAAESQVPDAANVPVTAERPHYADVPATAEEPPAAEEAVMNDLAVETVPELDPVRGPAEADLDASSLYLNRELSMLSFQERVLEEAEDHDNPLLERVKFLSIFSSNLAEFYMVRIAGLKQQVQAGVRDLSADGLTPAEQLAIVRESARQLIMRGRGLYSQLRDELAQNSIYVLGYDELDEHQRQDADRYFDDVVYPVLTPLAFDPARPFPHISNMSLNLAVLIRTPEGEERFARVKMPRALPRLVPICADAGAGPSCEMKGDDKRGRAHHFVWLEQLVAAHLGSIFPGMEVVEAHPFRVTRDADIAIQELEAEDLLETIEEGVRRRRFGSVVRVTVTPSLPDFVRDTLAENLKLDPEDLVIVKPPIGASNLMELYKIDRPDLKDPAFRPALLPGYDDAENPDMFAAIREHDILLHRPFDSFEPFVKLLQQAAEDPDVLAIKMTLYRVGRDSPVVEALLDAAENGKEVAALVELKARFDEESNIGWARKLEQAGVHVVYGVLGLKTHSKVALIVRKEGDRVRRYLHLGTGNYNVATALQYTDLDLLITDEVMGEDASELFNFLTGYAEQDSYESFLVAPVTIRQGFEALVRREMDLARAGRPARMILKMNSLVDRAMVRILYEASQAGVRIDLIVRGMCILRPGLPGVSDNINVTSIVGRFLEHTRIYFFENDGDPTVLIGSADLMRRNLDRRVEVLAPVNDPALIARLRGEILQTYLDDNVKARLMGTDGTYTRVRVDEGEERVDSQLVLMGVSAKRSGYEPGH
jgi:polyphosphate kinase